MARRIVCRCRPRPSSPTHAMSAAYSRSSLRSKQPPPTARHVGPHGPEPSAPHGSGPQERICSSSCLSWLHLLKSWSLRQSRGGSIRRPSLVFSPVRLIDFIPRGGAVYCRHILGKDEQLRRLAAIGILTPRTATLSSVSSFAVSYT